MIECRFREFGRTEHNPRVIGKCDAFLGYAEEIAIDLLIAIFVMIGLDRKVPGRQIRNDDDHGTRLSLGLPLERAILEERFARADLRMHHAIGVTHVLQFYSQRSGRGGPGHEGGSGKADQ